MDEQQVDVVGLQLAQALVDALCSLLLSCIRDPHLRHEKDVLTLHSALRDGSAHALFVIVGLRRIDEPIAHFKCIRHTLLRLLRRHQKYAIAQQWHLHSICKFDFLHFVQKMIIPAAKLHNNPRTPLI